MSSVSLDQILGELEKTESVSDNQIISNLLSRDNIELKTEIPIPPSAQNAATLKMVSELFKTAFSKRAGEFSAKHLTYSLEFAVSHLRGSREEVKYIFAKAGRQSPEINQQRKDLVGQIWGR